MSKAKFNPKSGKLTIKEGIATIVYGPGTPPVTRINPPGASAPKPRGRKPRGK